jgi:predicted nucleotidyltransferase component of viral defense system
MTPDYIDTVRLLLAIAPTVFASGRFAMKGGTALNLFVQDMPRLSVDIDVVYVDHRPDREAALRIISAELVTMKAALKAKGYRATLPANTQGDEVKLVVGNDATQVKVEVNFVFRGSVLPVETRSLVATAQDLFTTDVAIPVLATPELYGSKLVAAMDRQHPRDIFDVLHMLDRFGWQGQFVDCFVAYIAGHNRPVHEVLFPKTKPLEPAFSKSSPA